MYKLISQLLIISALSFCSLAVGAESSKDVKNFSKIGSLFTMEGSNTVGARLAPALVKAWITERGASNVTQTPLPAENEYRISGEINQQKVYVDIHAHGSTTGFKGLMENTADIAMASRAIKPQEVQNLTSTHGNLRSFKAEHVIAIDGLAIIVNPRNPIANLDVNTVGKIFSGEITNWKALGGDNLNINVLARDDKSGTYDTFKSLILGKTYTLTKKADRFESNDTLSDIVTSDPAAIGFVGMASIRKAKPLAIHDQETTALKPETLYVATEDYPITRRLFMYTAEHERSSDINDFIEFTLSKDGQKIVENIGFVSQNPIKMRVTNLAGPKEYEDLIDIGERLSVNFRFQPGQATLDNKARHDVVRVADYINNNADQSFKIKLVGFSDTKDTSTRAEVLSRLRASAVKIELYRLGIQTDLIMGFGAELLVANSSGSQRVKNDRVEVWLMSTNQ